MWARDFRELKCNLRECVHSVNSQDEDRTRTMQATQRSRQKSWHKSWQRAEGESARELPDAFSNDADFAIIPSVSTDKARDLGFYVGFYVGY